MSQDLTVMALTMQRANVRQLMQIAVLRKAHQMQTAVVDMIDQVTSRAPAPAGTGRVVDKRA
jgi:hypothetical protein